MCKLSGLHIDLDLKAKFRTAFAFVLRHVGIIFLFRQNCVCIAEDKFEYSDENYNYMIAPLLCIYGKVNTNQH